MSRITYHFKLAEQLAKREQKNRSIDIFDPTARTFGAIWALCVLIALVYFWKVL